MEMLLEYEGRSDNSLLHEMQKLAKELTDRHMNIDNNKWHDYNLLLEDIQHLRKRHG